MKITDKKSSGIGKVSRSSRGSRPRSEAVEPTGHAEAADTVEISSHAQAVEAIRELVATAPDIRAEQVARITDLLKQGKYKIDYKKVAESFIKHVIMEELSRKKDKIG